MTTYAQLAPAFDASSRAQLTAAWADAGTYSAPIVVTDVDTGNVDPGKVVVTSPESASPHIYLDIYGNQGWRHFSFAIENCEGRTPTFRFNLGSKDSGQPGPDYLPAFTQDFVTWTNAPAVTISGTTSGGYIEWTFAEPLPAGRIYIASSPLGRQADAVTLAADLLTNYSQVAAPTLSADQNGVFFTSPLELDERGRQIGGHPLYAIKLSWPVPTVDGGPKRKLVQLAGIHAAGENQSFYSFKAAVMWMLNDSSQEAQNFRANWDVFIYFNISPNGVYSGNKRVNHYQRSSDPNRDWDGTSALVEIANTKAALLADVGSCDAFWSWHGHHTATQSFIPGKNVQNYTTPDAAHSAFISIGSTIFGTTALNYGSTVAETDAWWAQENLGTTIAFHAEIGTRSGANDLKYKGIGESWVKTLQAVDAAGWFGEAPAGTLTLGTPSTTSSSISLPWTYSAADHEGIEYRYRLTAGTWSAWIDAGLVSPIEITGLTSGAEYEVEAQAYNATGTGTPQTTTITVGVESDLVIASATSATTSDSATVSQTHVLLVADALSATTSEVAQASQGGQHAVAATDSTSATTSDSATVSQTHVLLVADALSATTSEVAQASQGGQHAVAATDSTSATLSETASILQTHRILVSDVVSATLSSTASAGAASGSPTGLEGTPGQHSITWVWEAVSGAAGYEIEYGPVGGPHVRADTGSVTSFEQTGLSGNTQYEARVRSYV